MQAISRRSVLAGAAATGLGLLGAGAAAAAPGRVPVRREEHRVVVVGSGFGGGVTALRFAEAGIPVTVLERGRRWPTGPDADTFPRPTRTPDERMIWMGSVTDPLDEQTTPLSLLLGGLGRGTPLGALGRYVGVLERVSGVGMDTFCAAGVGGGSLLYQGMSLQPTRELFETTMPSDLDYGLLAREHYPRVARMLRLATAPDELVESPTYAAARAFRHNAEAAGYDVEKIPMPIDWDFALRELRGEMAPSYTNGDCAFGVNNGGKHSVDVTYLAAAEATGLVTVAPQHQVTDVARTADGRYEVHVDRIATDGTVLERKILTTTALVLAAGTANTNRLLLRAREQGTIPDLPDALGENWGTNGDRICTWTSLTDDFGSPQGGPVVYGSKDWSDPATANTVIQASLPPLPDLRTTMTVGYGVSEGRGRYRWDPVRGEAVLHWPPDGDAALTRRIHERMNRIIGPGGVLLDTTYVVPTTWHPLGGACIGTVCDAAGRVYGQRGLYVLDGSLMPGTTAACNPSMTIAAVVERATDELVAADAGTVF
ncbi:cholesterol oxidase [Pseudonocardia sp. EC080610-09]|uniref:GMC oxidoreductase n=1 Tax=unclassified Pseudonocardia TaxID=2619320 RepID=UPI0006CB0E0E|nr:MULTISPECIES: GMC oxidoreductase [unclassified Pseudonocardia]ALE75593.1 cholesterol oxidase [Pseudonocardia sp. EC080625-04]ALL74971.1 cholesterol oxidase [Pseudonocardia sp. EC080610-09]ALL81993.1 cholesterol oxidase [Pseudonocardia sp. EC080619-01]